MSITGHRAVTHEGATSRRVRRGTPCAVCGAPVTHTGAAQRYCSRRCADAGQTLVGDTEIAGIINARRCGVPWTIIAADLQVSVATAQRACARANAPVDLPDWIVAEKTSDDTRVNTQRTAGTVAKEMSPRATLNPQRKRENAP
jgi:hypothetical protein